MPTYSEDYFSINYASYYTTQPFTPAELNSPDCPPAAKAPFQKSLKKPNKVNCLLSLFCCLQSPEKNENETSRLVKRA